MGFAKVGENMRVRIVAGVIACLVLMIAFPCFAAAEGVGVDGTERYSLDERLRQRPSSTEIEFIERLSVEPSRVEPVSASINGAPDGGSAGAPIFETHCAGCHLNGGNIIRRGKTLKMNALKRNQMDSVEAIAHIVTVGKRPMSAYQETLSADEIQAVSIYVLERAEHDWK